MEEKVVQPAINAFSNGSVDQPVHFEWERGVSGNVGKVSSTIILPTISS
jgi:hypothetical protein